MPAPTSILDHPLVASRYFFPRYEAFAEPYWVETHDGCRLACAYHTVPTATKTVIYFHGNGEIVADYLPDFPQWLARAGCNVLLAEYRGYGMSTGQPALASMLDDVSAILQRLGLPPRQVVVFGRSLGSLYAVHGAAQYPDLAGIILESGISDISERFFMRVEAAELGVTPEVIRQELQRHFDYVAKLKSFQGQTLILHTRHDELVPVRHAERLYAAAPEPKTLHIFEQGGHNDIFYWNRDTYMQLVEAFLARV